MVVRNMPGVLTANKGDCSAWRTDSTLCGAHEKHFPPDTQSFVSVCLTHSLESQAKLLKRGKLCDTERTQSPLKSFKYGETFQGRFSEVSQLTHAEMVYFCFLHQMH